KIRKNFVPEYLVKGLSKTKRKRQFDGIKAFNIKKIAKEGQILSTREIRARKDFNKIYDLIVSLREQGYCRDVIADALGVKPWIIRQICDTGRTPSRRTFAQSIDVL